MGPSRHRAGSRVDLRERRRAPQRRRRVRHGHVGGARGDLEAGRARPRLHLRQERPSGHRAQPAAQRRPARRRAHHPRRDRVSYRGGGLTQEPPSRQRQCDRRPRVVPARRDLARHHGEDGSASAAPVATHPQDRDHRRFVSATRAAQLSIAAPVAHDPQRAPRLARCCRADRAPRRPDLVDLGHQRRDPELARHRRMNESAAAPIIDQRHSEPDGGCCYTPSSPMCKLAGGTPWSRPRARDRAINDQAARLSGSAMARDPINIAEAVADRSRAQRQACAVTSPRVRLRPATILR
jgi:hypothetical protein